jgi:hypothetical protein
LSCSERVAGGGFVDSMLRFRLEMGGDEMNRCRKMKRRQQTRLSPMERKRDTAGWRDNVRQRRGGIEEGKGRRRRQLG